MVKNLPAMWETQVRSLGQKDPLEKGMATHSRFLAWRILWTEEPGGPRSMGLQAVRHDWVPNTFALPSVPWACSSHCSDHCLNEFLSGFLLICPSHSFPTMQAFAILRILATFSVAEELLVCFLFWCSYYPAYLSLRLPIASWLLSFLQSGLSLLTLLRRQTAHPIGWCTVSCLGGMVPSHCLSRS